MNPIDIAGIIIWSLAVIYFILILVRGISWDIHYRFVPPEVFYPIWIVGIPIFIGLNIQTIQYGLPWDIVIPALNIAWLIITKILWIKKIYFGGDARAYFAVGLLMPCGIILPIVMIISLILGYMLGTVLDTKYPELKNRGFPVYLIITPVSLISIVWFVYSHFIV